MTNKIDKIQMPNGEVLELGYSELNNPYSLFDSKYSDHELNNLSWLKSEGQWNAKSVYPDAYDKLLKVYNGTETVEGLSVKLSTEEYTDYDFVLNTTDETFRLPLLNGDETLPNYENGTSKLINTNITAETNGYFYGYFNTEDNAAVYITINGVIIGTTSPLGTYADERTPYSFFVKKGDVFYINSSTRSDAISEVNFCPAKGNGSLYFYVGETVQNANLIDAGRIGEQLATKTDKVQAANSSMPSGKYIDLTLGASGSTYTAPANGWFYAYTVATGQYSFLAWERQDTMMQMHIPSANDGYGCGIYIPARKNDEVNLYYGNKRFDFLRFIYAEGEV